jgi:hypothetical protein
MSAEEWAALAARRLRKARQLKRYHVAAARAGGRLTVDPTGTTRRVRALAAIGHPLRDVAARLGTADASNMARHARGDSPRVTLRTARRVAAVYEEMRDTPGPSPTTARRAKRAKWLPPAAWDGSDIDDPAAVPWQRAEVVDEVAVQRVLREGRGWKQLRQGERLETLRRLLEEEGLPVESLRHRLRTSQGVVDRLLRLLDAA